MSYDFSTERVCSHEVVREASVLEPNGHLFASFQKPPLNQSVRLEIDGADIPPGGLFSVPRLPFSKPEPYRIKAGVSDLLFVRVGFDQPQFVQIISGSNLRAADLAQDLQKKIPSLAVTVESGRIVFSGRQSGAYTAFSFPDPRWTDRTSSLPSTARVLAAFGQLGIVPGRSVYGKKLFPSWSLALDPESPDGTGRRIRFDSPLLNHDPVLRVSYITDAQNCRRCNGTRFEFDYSIVDGTYDTVRDTDLLAQEFDKFVFTRAGSHWKWTWLGSGIVDRIGGKSSSNQTTANAMINLDISQAFRTYQNIKQQQDSRFPFQQVSDAEYPASLGGITVRTSPDDPTVAVAVTTVSSRSRVQVPLKRVIGTPSPFVVGPNSIPFRLRG